MSRTETLFLYGRLLQRTGNTQVDRIISRSTRPLYRGFTHGRLYDLGHYPGLLESTADTDRVFGMVVELSRASFCLPLIDKFEDFREKQPQKSLYLRRKITVHATDRHKTIDAWCYVYNRPINDEQEIRNGDWLAYANRNAG